MGPILLNGVHGSRWVGTGDDSGDSNDGTLLFYRFVRRRTLSCLEVGDRRDMRPRENQTSQLEHRLSAGLTRSRTVLSASGFLSGENEGCRADKMVDQSASSVRSE